ncbi:hypothetical protein E3J61_00785 [Candidatus Dependentiae bacterium]|nr:MAG: hypothetical protein E3J61_00785 [Candidatus Dependentiae bacterium]
MNKPFAEIIESSLHTWLAQSWQWNQPPHYGSLVAVQQEKRTLIGLVYEVGTGSMDPTRYPFAYQKTQEELLREQPQIFEFLKTTFSCLVLGYHHQDRMRYITPSQPATIHSFVQPISDDLNRQFFAHDQYIHRIFGLGNKINNIDELLLALIGQQMENKLMNQEKIMQFMDTYSLLTGNDYRRIKLFLQRVERTI